MSVSIVLGPQCVANLRRRPANLAQYLHEGCEAVV